MVTGIVAFGLAFAGAGVYHFLIFILPPLLMQLLEISSTTEDSSRGTGSGGDSLALGISLAPEGSSTLEEVPAPGSNGNVSLVSSPSQASDSSMPSDEVWTQQTTINLGVFFFRFDHLPTYYREDIGSKIQDIHHVFRECIDQRPQAGHEPSWSEVHSLCCELQKLINDAENYTPPRGKNVEKYIRINATGESITIGFGDGEALELDFSTPPPFSSIEHLRDATVPPTEEEVHLFGMLFLSIADLEECLAFYGTFEFPTRSVSVHLLAAARAVQRALDDIVHYTRDPVQGIDDPTILVYPVQGNIRITYGEDEAFHLQWPKGQGLPPHLLRMVPRHTVDDALLASDGQKDCSICLEQMENGQRILKLLCGHYYHDACVSEWFENKRTCPICRYDVMTTSYEHDAHHHAHDHAHHHDHHHDGH